MILNNHHFPYPQARFDSSLYPEKILTLIPQHLPLLLFPSPSPPSKIRSSSVAAILLEATTLVAKQHSTPLPRDKLFALLCHIRIAKSFHSRNSRTDAIRCRLLALQVLLCMPSTSTDVLVGYFQAQPELCAEICDLVRPASVYAENLGTGKRTEVPHRLRMAALDVLTTIVSRRDSSSANLGPIGRFVDVFGELGVAKGQYLGLLPTLMRYSVASLGALPSLSEGKTSNSALDSSLFSSSMTSKPEKEEDPDLSLGNLRCRDASCTSPRCSSGGRSFRTC